MPGFNCRRIYTSLFLLLVVFLHTSSCRAETVRIGLLRYFRNTTEIKVTASTDYQIIDPSVQEPLASCAPDTPVTLKSGEKSILLSLPDGSSKEVAADIEIKPAAPDGIIAISSSKKRDARYRGTLGVRFSKGSLQLINCIDLEDYLLSVVPSEMPSGFPIEALKAQAIAARTYAVVTKGKHKDIGFDLCDEVNCQAYTGVSGEKASTTQAVKDTAGMIMTYEGKPICAQFSADCGGQTKAGNQPYLKSVPDKPDGDSPDFCSGSKHHVWCVLYTPHQLACAFSKTPTGDFSNIKAFAVKESDEGGRIKKIEITDENGTKTISSLDLRRALGMDIIKSDLFTISSSEDGSFQIQGKGYGHGIGLCQHGANGMAREPQSCTYEQILKHYYSGVEITKL